MSTRPLLLIEDNPGDALLLRMALTRVSAWDFRQAESLADGLACCAESPPPLLAFCDLGLPDSNGLETLKTLRARASQIPVIVVTGTDDDGIGQAAIELGAQDFLVKGDYSEHTLGRCVRYALSRHQLLGEVEAARQRLQNVLLDAPMVVYSICQQDGGLHLDYCSDTTDRLLGFSRDMVGNDARYFVQALGADQAGDFMQALERAPDNDTHIVAEHAYRHPDGRSLWLQHRVAVYRRGEHRRIIGTIIDRSEEHESQRLREEHVAEVAAKAAKDKLLAVVSHELRNPLQAIIGNAELLLASPNAHGDPQVTERLQRIIGAGERMSSLIAQLLGHGRVDFGIDPDALVPVDLTAVLQAIAADLWPRLAEHDVSLCHLPEGPELVLGQEQALHHVFINIIDNAIKYGGDHTTIDLKVTGDEGHVRCQVIDYGCGIAHEHLAEVCEPFFQTGLVDVGGVGLGLNLATELVAQMRGSLRIDSPGVGCGCTVTVELMRAQRMVHA